MQARGVLVMNNTVYCPPSTFKHPKIERLLFVSHLYPSSVEPGRAVFNHQLVKALDNICEMKVIAPYFWFPGKSTLPRREMLDGVDVVHPRIFYMPGLLVHKHWILYRMFVKSCFLRMTEEFKPDHVILGFLYPDVVAMAPLCRELGVEYSVRVNGSDFHLRTAQEKFAGMIMWELKQAPRIFCPGNALKDAMVNKGIDAEKITVFENGVDGEMFRYRAKAMALDQLLVDRCSLLGGGGSLSESFRGQESVVCSASPCDAGAAHGAALQGESRWTEIKNKKMILFVGNLVKVKGPDVLIEAFAKILQGRVNSKQLAVSSEREEKRNRRYTPMNGMVEEGEEKVSGKRLGESRQGQDREQQSEDRGQVSGLSLHPFPSGFRSPPSALLFIGSGPMRKNLQRRAEELGIAESVIFLGSRPHEEVAHWMNVADCLCLSSRSEGMPNVVLEALTSGLPVVATDVGECGRILADEPNSRVVPSSDADKMAAALNDVLNMDVDRETMAEKYKGRYSWDRAAREILKKVSSEQ